MNRYRKLATNTGIFAIGTFSSKLLVFLMLPLYTRTLTNAEYGEIDLIVQTCNLIIPIISAGIMNAVIRFGLERNVDKKSIFSISLITIIFGFIVLFVAEPIFANIEFMQNYLGYAYLYVLVSVLHSLCSNFVRSQELVKLYAFDGMLRTVLTIILNIIFLVVLSYGVVGYLLATILSDAIATATLFFSAKLYRFISLNSINKNTAWPMFKYALPLVPTTISVWIVSISDRYILSYMIGNEATGLYAIAYKVPTIITIIAAIFIDAWQISSITEYPKQDGARFFSKVFGAYSSLVFIASSVIIAFTKFLTDLLVSSDFYTAWCYVPVLVLSTVFACFATFASSIYMNEKKSKHILFTTIASAVINIILNIVLIPVYGIQGAAIATFFSYIVMFIIRATHSRLFIKMIWETKKITFNSVVLILQTIIVITEIQNWFMYEMVFVVVIFVVNIKTLLIGAKKVLE